MHLEIVTHCWNYSRLLTYQLSSLVLAPPRHLSVTMSVFYTCEDVSTSEAVEFFARQSVPNIEWKPRLLTAERLLCRGIGRNDAALGTKSDWIWFSDADYCFLEGCLDSLVRAVQQLPADSCPLLFPATVQMHRSPELGDAAIEEANGVPRLLTVRPEEFETKSVPRAIGGLQICSGDVARRTGYCPGHRRYRRRPSTWQRTSEDVGFRRSLGTRGVPIPVQNLFRIRHSRCGYLDTDVRL